MLEGEIRDIHLITRLVELWREQFTGAIRFENDGIIKIVYFKGGDILSASTNDRADSIDEILMRAGKVSREHVKQALAKRKESETLGDALLNLGFITRKELTWARRVQVVGVIRSIAAWSTGSFTIVADYLPKRDEGTLFLLPQVLVELIVTDQDRATFERALDGGSAVFAKSHDFEDVFRRLGLNEDAEAIAAQIDGVKSAADVAASAHRDAFNAYKLMHALSTLGVLTRVDRAEPHFALDDFASAGVADAADMLAETQQSPMPQFQLDEAEALKQPTLEVPSTAFTASAPPPQTSAWDEPEEESAPPPPPPPKMPAWDVAPRAAAAVPISAPIKPSAEASEEQWGFDDAQIETAKRASNPERPRAAKKKPPAGGRRYGLLVALMVVFVVAAGGYFGLRWFFAREEKAVEAMPANTVTVTQTVDAPPVTVKTATPVETTVTLPEMAPTSTATAPAGLQVTPTVAPPAPAAAQPLPPVVPRQTGDRYEAMAREFAANPAGNFTVQIQILCETSNLDAAILAGGANLWFVPQPIGNRSCYRVFWGRYATRADAERALPTIPAKLRDQNAAVRAISR